MRLLPAIVIAISIILAPVLWYVIPMLLPAGEEYSGFDGPAVDSQARIDLEMIRQNIDGLISAIQQQQTTIEGLQSELGSLSARLQRLEAGGGGFGQKDRQDGSAEPYVKDGPNTIIDAYAQVVLIADRRNVNQKLKLAGSSYLTKMLGPPRTALSDNCEPMTNQKLKNMLVVEQVGPIKVQMLQPAVDSLKTVFENVRRADQDLYDRISTAGSLCVRRIRGSRNSVSTHSFGLSVDLNIDGHLDTLGDGKTQLGLTILADFFRDEGWFWGAGFSREDSMHFEVSRGKLEEWRAEGKI